MDDESGADFDATYNAALYLFYGGAAALIAAFAVLEYLHHPTAATITLFASFVLVLLFEVLNDVEHGV